MKMLVMLKLDPSYSKNHPQWHTGNLTKQINLISTTVLKRKSWLAEKVPLLWGV